MTDEEIELVAQALLQAEGETIVRDMAQHVADELHVVLKRHGMTMRTAGGGAAMGIFAAAQVLSESLFFARHSMNGDADDEAAIVQAGCQLFLDHMPAPLRAVLIARASSERQPEAPLLPDPEPPAVAPAGGAQPQPETSHG